MKNRTQNSKKKKKYMQAFHRQVLDTQRAINFLRLVFHSTRILIRQETSHHAIFSPAEPRTRPRAGRLLDARRSILVSFLCLHHTLSQTAAAEDADLCYRAQAQRLINDTRESAVVFPISGKAERLSAKHGRSEHAWLL